MVDSGESEKETGKTAPSLSLVFQEIKKELRDPPATEKRVSPYGNLSYNGSGYGGLYLSDSKATKDDAALFEEILMRKGVDLEVGPSRTVFESSDKKTRKTAYWLFSREPEQEPNGELTVALGYLPNGLNIESINYYDHGHFFDNGSLAKVYKLGTPRFLS